ncbi:MAG: VRR-NUC domain-containing protein, partial [Acetobacteraceae bacterium]
SARATETLARPEDRRGTAAEAAGGAGVTPEGQLMRLIMRDCSRGPVRLLRNNCGVGIQVPGAQIRLACAILARHGIEARPLRYGIGNPGGSDLLGVRRLTIGAEHVGQRIGQAVALEVKTPSGRVSEDQRRFLAAAASAGCCVGVPRSVQEAAAMLGARIQVPT